MHCVGMRTHKLILKEAGGADAVHAKLTSAPSLHTVRSWLARNSIPAEWWSDLAALEIATLDELASAAALRREAA